MTITESIISGLVQGVTEFLPVSSSGHLVILHKFFGYSEPVVFFDICLHAGTLLSVLVFFGRYIVSLVKEKDARILGCVAIGTVPAVAAALLFEHRIEELFVNPRSVAVFWVVTALMLFSGQIAQSKGSRHKDRPTFGNSLLIGIAQATALLPGISRSGTTISTGLFAGLKAEDAFRFSFLLSIPAVLGALLYKSLKVGAIQVISKDLGAYIAGAGTAFIAGLVSLFFLWRALKVKRMYIFGIYCLLLGVFGIIFW